MAGQVKWRTVLPRQDYRPGEAHCRGTGSRLLQPTIQPGTGPRLTHLHQPPCRTGNMYELSLLENLNGSETIWPDDQSGQQPFRPTPSSSTAVMYRPNRRYKRHINFGRTTVNISGRHIVQSCPTPRHSSVHCSPRPVTESWLDSCLDFKCTVS